MATVTTLIIEYLAKPWLEARKDRILEKSKERHAAIRDLKRVAFLAGRLYGCRNMADVALTQERARKIAENIEPLLTSIHEVMDVAEIIREEWTEATSIVAGFSVLFLTAKASEEAWGEFDKAGDLLDTFSELLTTPTWQVKHKYMLIQKIKTDSLALRVTDSKTAPDV